MENGGGNGGWMAIGMGAIYLLYFINYDQQELCRHQPIFTEVRIHGRPFRSSTNIRRL